MNMAPPVYPKYPKIDTLYNRGDDFKVIPDEDHLRLKEAALIRRWTVTEKIDGTNTRIIFEPNCMEGGCATEVIGPTVFYGGRTDKTDPSMFERLGLVDLFDKVFTVDKLAAAFPDMDGPVVLFGESYGPKINGGGAYSSVPSFRLFDVLVGNWWLERSSVEDIAAQLDIKAVPVWGYKTGLGGIVELVRQGFPSFVSMEEGDGERMAEGIVARTEPLLLRRNGKPLVIKLKTKDFG